MEGNEIEYDITFFSFFFLLLRIKLNGIDKFIKNGT